VKRGYVESSWGLSENNRRAKFYRITTRGRQQLHRETGSWAAFTEAVAKVLDGTERPEWA
jgi:DNA-binding PadR family transcriptional regulator